MASHNKQETEIRRKFLSKISPLAFYFKERFPDYLNHPTVEPCPIPVCLDVDMIVGDASSATRSNRNYTAFQLSLELGQKEDLTCNEQRATYYIGGICCLMPEVTDGIQQGVHQRGNRVRIVRVPSGAALNDLVIPPQKANAFFGYLVIMLYKNVTEANLKDLSDRRLEELFGAAGYAPRQGEDVSVFKVARHAIRYRSFGQLGRIKEAVLKGILNHSKDKDSFGNVCSYVAKILSWTDMGGFYNVYKTLVLTDSPVLRAWEVADEVMKLQLAVKAVFDTEMPQYFKILVVNRSKYYMVDRSKFAKLSAITEKIMRKTTNVSSRFSAPWLDSFVAMHENQLVTAQSAN